jgi:hypothetical protein
VGKLYIRKGGFKPTHGNANIAYSGVSVLYDGERRVGSSRGNAVFEVVYTTLGDNVLDLQAAQDQIAIMSEQVRLRAEKGIGELVRFKYRMPDGLDDVPDPIIGEWSRYYELIDLEPQLPETLYDLARGNVVEAIVARITAKPLAEGVPQPAFNCTVDVKNDAGFLVTRAYSNLIDNPDFVYTANFGDGWTIPLALSGVTDQTVYRVNNTKSARFSNYTAGALDITQAVDTGDATPRDYSLGVICRRNDGGAVSASQLTLLAGGGVISGVRFVQLPFTDWYSAFGIFSASNIVTIGIRIAANTIINLQSVVMCTTPNDNMPPVYISGDMPGAAWAGATPRRRTTNRTHSVVGQSMSAQLKALDLMGDFSISFMVTFLFESNVTYAGIGVVPFVRYIAQASGFNLQNMFRCYYDRTNRRFTVLKNVGGTNYSFNYSRNITYGETLHFTLTQSGTTLRLYLNGVSVGSVECPYFTLTGTNVFYAAGITQTEVATGQYALDMLKVWDGYALGQAEITALYTMQNVRKAAGIVELPITLQLSSGYIYGMIDGDLSDVYNPISKNYGVLTVSGTAPAIVDLSLTFQTEQIPSPSQPHGFRVGLWPESCYRDNGRLHWSELSFGSVGAQRNDPDATWDTYSLITLNTFAPTGYLIQSNVFNDDEEAARILKGTYALFVKFFLPVTSVAFYATPFYSSLPGNTFVGSPNTYGKVLGKRRLINTVLSGLNYLGEISIEDEGQSAITWGAYIERATANVTLRFDYMVLIPKDYLSNIYGSAATPQPESLHISDNLAQAEIDGAMSKLYNREGPPLRAWPGLQNILMIIYYDDTQVAPAPSNVIGIPRLTITPRYTD